MKTVLLLFVLLLCTAITAFAAGNELGNGGDLVAQEFVAAGRTLVQQLREKPDSRIPDVEKLADAVEHVKVTSAGHLTLHGAEVDAINYPEQREIDVNRPRWENADPEKRASLVLHEYLGVIQVPDLHYEISASYAAPFAIPEEKPKKFTVGLGTSFGWNAPLSPGHESTQQPGIDAHAAWSFTRRDDVTLEFDRQQFGYSQGNDSNTDSFLQFTLSYRRWLNESKSWRPYVQAGGGYGWRRYDWSFPDSERSYEEVHFHNNYDDGDFLLRLGAGVRQPLMRDVSLHLGLRFDNIGKPWEWNSYNKILAGQAGVDMMF